MQESLLSKIKENFPKYRISELNNVLLLTLCIVQVGTVNLYKLRGHVARLTGKSVQSNSSYKRLIRIFDRHAYSRLWLDLLLYVFQLLRLESQYLILDGTSWKRYGVTRHYLTLSILYKEVAIPIYWIDLSKLGISSIKERKKMFRRAINVFNLKGKLLLADREYIGTSWYTYLIDNGIDFVIRLRSKNYQQAIDQAQGKTYAQMIAKVMRSKKPDKALAKRVVIAGNTYTFVVVKNPDASAKDKVLFLLSSLDQAASTLALQYRKRWNIECCFKHLKSNGFDLEQINVRNKARAKLMMAVVVFGYVLAIHEGLRTYQKVRVIQRPDGSREKAESVFRYGYDRLIARLHALSDFFEYIYKEIQKARKAYRSAKWVNV